MILSAMTIQEARIRIQIMKCEGSVESGRHRPKIPLPLHLYTRQPILSLPLHQHKNLYNLPSTDTRISQIVFHHLHRALRNTVVYSLPALRGRDPVEDGIDVYWGSGRGSR